ncbi:MAG: SGNH/GDSL hydrolase family protein [Clostridia bacterium]|nr:SGNH/GDSL hydrolase family protein [Clostridia bacterium]
MPPMTFCCLGDSITSDQVTGIGTVVARKLHAAHLLNAACGYATCTDWHDGDVNITPITLIEPPNTNTADNVLSNQVRRVLQSITPAGEIIRWTADGADYALNPSVGLGTGTLPCPDVIYIAISTNDGNQPYNAVTDDFETVARQSYAHLTRNSLASALRWAIETLQAACPGARIFVATPLQTYTDLPHMSHDSGLLKRRLVTDVCRLCGAECIDSFMESGFDRTVAKDHGEVHPDEEWKERIACYVTKKIASRLL